MCPRLTVVEEETVAEVRNRIVERLKESKLMFLRDEKRFSLALVETEKRDRVLLCCWKKVFSPVLLRLVRQNFVL